jgi:hypothetical protein
VIPRIAIVAAAWTFLIEAQPPRERSYEQRVDDLAASASSMTLAELQAEVLLRLSALQVPASRKIEYATRAFHLAGGAKSGHAWRYRGRATDTRDWLIAEASQLAVDRLSLQSRAAGVLLALDSIAARELFETISLPPARHAACGEDLTANTAAYFDIAATILSRAYGAADRRKGAPQAAAASFYSKVNDVHSIEDALRSLARLQADSELHAIAAGALLRRASELRFSERDAEFLIRDARLQNAVIEADTRLAGVLYPKTSAADFFRAVSKAAHYASPCGPLVPVSGKETKTTSPRAQYVQLLERLGLAHLVEPWPEDQRDTAASYMPVAASRNFFFWAEGDMRDMLRAVQTMNSREPDPDRDWDQRLAALQRRIAAWKRPDSVDTFTFAEAKFLLLMRMVELQPEAKTASAWMHDLLSQAFSHREGEANPGHKGVFIQRILDLGRAGREKAPSEYAEKRKAIEAAIAQFADPDLTVYRELEEISPGTVRSWAR